MKVLSKGINSIKEENKDSKLREKFKCSLKIKFRTPIDEQNFKMICFIERKILYLISKVTYPQEEY